MNTLAKVADQCRQLLTEQQISASSPGPILNDVQVLIDFIGIGGLRTKSHQGNLPAAVLSDLNAWPARVRFSDFVRALIVRGLAGSQSRSQ